MSVGNKTDASMRKFAFRDQLQGVTFNFDGICHREKFLILPVYSITFISCCYLFFTRDKGRVVVAKYL